MTVRCNRGYSNGASEKAKKKRHTSKKQMTKKQKKETHPGKSNRWTTQLNRKSVRDWRRSSRQPRRSCTVQLYRYSSTSSTSSTCRCLYLGTATGSSPRRCCGVECILLGTTEGTATERAKKQKKRHTSKKNDKGAKKANTPVTV